jgi:hypothetical protein
MLEMALQLISALTLAALYWSAPPWRWAVGALGLGLAALCWLGLPHLAHRLGSEHFSRAPRAGQSLVLGAAVGLLYVAFWGLHGAALAMVARGLCITQPVPLAAATASMALAWASGFVVLFVPAGLGIREWALSALLVSTTALSSDQASLLAVTARLVLILAELALLLVGLVGPLHRVWRRSSFYRWNKDDQLSGRRSPE